jgi:hypothetical protein
LPMERNPHSSEADGLIVVTCRRSVFVELCNGVFGKSFKDGTSPSHNDNAQSAPTRVSSVDTALLYATDSATLIHLILHLLSLLSCPCHALKVLDVGRGELSTSHS